MEIYVSTVAFAKSHTEQIIRTAKKYQWALEFSSGLPYMPNMEQVYKTADIKRIPHNYFPAPETPFVLNLASANKKIRQQSLAHCKKAMELALRSHSPFFAAHAGFCIDPEVNELGKKISYKPHFDRTFHKEIFIDSIQEILLLADKIEIDFLIENNVVAMFNLTEGINPLLCCESEEIKWLFTTINHKRFGLLLDTAHLKVSCNTLKLDLWKEFESIKSFVKAFHHSDNNGLVDDNQPLKEDYWLYPVLSSYQNYPHVLEIKNIESEVIANQINLLKKWMSKN